ncbi:MAG: NUDIX domain-containing protein [Capnocytophaga sp.]|nr:NUDIX domain-containing protein [Capnocytophaga sp.]
MDKKTYKIFYNEKQIILTNHLTSKLLKYKIFLLEDISIKEFISKIEHKKLKKVVIFYPETDIFEKFLQKIERIQAGGGVVQNDLGEILFIKRKGKWDLPKGKLEKKENISECALREVEEETGVTELSLGDFRGITYHIFSRDNKFFLKETHWFNMFSSFNKDFTPQIEEDIEKVAWKSSKKLEKTLKKSFLSIKELFINEKI